MTQVLLNPAFRPDYRSTAPDAGPLAVHRRLPGYAPTPLRDLPDLARRCGVASVSLKDESNRLGLPAYKILGAAWATLKLLRNRLGDRWERWETVDELRERLAEGPGLRLVTATDGNHGRGVARVARWLGLDALVFLPRGSAPSRVEGIRSEGAEVVEVPGTYDEAVEQAAAVVGEEILLIQDHGWPGYEEIPNWIADGYETIFAEIDMQLADAGAPAPDLVLVQIGVGTLASAVVRHYRRPALRVRPVIAGVEPTGAACALHSVAAGHPVMLRADAHSSIMAGLNCGTPSSAAWPALLEGVESYIAVEDDLAREAMRTLAGVGVVAGESGAAGVAGLLALAEPGRAAARAALGMGAATRVLLLSTEGATDPEAYAAIVRTAPPR